MTNKNGGYDVGYKKPPKGSQYPPGVSGNKGRRKRPETQDEMVARVRDEKVQVAGKWITKLELAVQQTFNQTIKSGKPRDLKILFDLMDKHGLAPEADRLAEMRAGADRVMEMILNRFDAEEDIDPADVSAMDQFSREEAKLVMSCSHCGPDLRSMWATAERKGLDKRYGKTGLHRQVEEAYTAGSK